MDVRERLVGIVSAAVGMPAADIQNNHDLMSLGLDSLGLFDVAVQIEKDFDIELEDAVLNRIQSVDDLIAAVEGRVRLRASVQ